MSECVEGGRLIDVEGAEEVAALAKVLSDPVRLRIFHHIVTSNEASVCACNLPDLFGVSQPTLSHHLKKLVTAGLVGKEMKGKWAHFTPRSGVLDRLSAFLADVGGA